MSEIPEIKVTFPGGLRVDAEYKGFVVKTDQPVHQGGEGTASSPFDLFLISIATCAGFYAVAFCKERVSLRTRPAFSCGWKRTRKPS